MKRLLFLFLLVMPFVSYSQINKIKENSKKAATGGSIQKQHSNSNDLSQGSVESDANISGSDGCFFLLDLFFQILASEPVIPSKTPSVEVPNSDNQNQPPNEVAPEHLNPPVDDTPDEQNLSEQTSGTSEAIDNFPDLFAIKIGIGGSADFARAFYTFNPTAEFNYSYFGISAKGYFNVQNVDNLFQHYDNLTANAHLTLPFDQAYLRMGAGTFFDMFSRKNYFLTAVSWRMYNLQHDFYFDLSYQGSRYPTDAGDRQRAFLNFDAFLGYNLSFGTSDINFQLGGSYVNYYSYELWMLKAGIAIQLKY